MVNDLDLLLVHSTGAKDSNCELSVYRLVVTFFTYIRLSLSRTRLSRITAYLEVKIWSLF